MANNTDNWKSAGSLKYSRMLSSFLDRINSGIDRGDDAASIAYVEMLFKYTAANPTDHAQRTLNEAQAKREEDGESTR